jgi:hypothetical protein
MSVILTLKSRAAFCQLTPKTVVFCKTPQKLQCFAKRLKRACGILKINPKNCGFAPIHD